MTDRKNPKLDMRRYKGLFFNLGLVVALSLVLTAFEWKTVTPVSMIDLPVDIDESLIIEPPITEIKPPPPPKVQNPVIIEIPNEEEIKEDFEIEVDIDTHEEQIIEDIVFTDQPKAEEVEVIHDIVESYPEFMNGGKEAFLKYVGSQLKYPAQARRMNIEGKVFVQFVVDKTGKMTDIHVIRGIGAGCDEEVLRVLTEAPAWEPGKQRGKPVKVRMIVPVTFRLN